MTAVREGVVRAEVASEVAQIVASGRRPPHLTAVLVGDDAASATYVRLKHRDCAEVGMTSSTEALPATTTQDELLQVIHRLFHSLIDHFWKFGQ